MDNKEKHSVLKILAALGGAGLLGVGAHKYSKFAKGLANRSIGKGALIGAGIGGGLGGVHGGLTGLYKSRLKNAVLTGVTGKGVSKADTIADVLSGAVPGTFNGALNGAIDGSIINAIRRSVYKAKHPILSKFASVEKEKNYPVSRVLTSPITGATIGGVGGLGKAAIMQRLGMMKRGPKTLLMSGLLGTAGGAGIQAINRIITARATQGRANKSVRGISPTERQLLEKLRKGKQ